MTKVPPGISGRPPEFDVSNVSHETLVCETALLSLGDFEPLDYKIDVNAFAKDISPFNNDWVDYLPRTDRPNNRTGLSLMNYPGWTHTECPSMPEAYMKLGTVPKETDFNTRTDLYNACKSLQPFLDDWQPLGRTFLVKSDIGGHFVPHRDHPSMPRETFRLIAFLNNCGPTDYDWLMDDRKIQIEPGRVYYVNTRKTHRTISWVNDSTHLILNVPFTSSNVSKVLAHLLHRH
jgi:hypothetical protein